MQGLNGSAPQVNRYPEGNGINRLYYSMRDQALLTDKMIRSGYGVLRAGTLMVLMGSFDTRNADMAPMVPYTRTEVIDTNSDTEKWVGVTPVLAFDDVAETVTIPLDYVKRFKVGDEVMVYVNDTGATDANQNEITVITVTANGVTLTIPGVGAAIATATELLIGPCSRYDDFSGKTVYVLDKDVDTGSGTEGIGAMGVVLMSNAIIYKGSIPNYNSEILPFLGASADGQHIIIK